MENTHTNTNVNIDDNIEILYLQSFLDAPDGKLFIGEESKPIPFVIKRFYFINQLANPEAVRGKHAHKNLDQVIFCINGSFELHLEDRQNNHTILLDNPAMGVRIRKMVWHTMTKFSPNCVILVVANDFYNEDDYIREYDEFLKYKNEKGSVS